MAISVQCGKCGQRLSGKDELAGRTVKCPKCGNPLAIPAPTPALEPIGGQWDLLNEAFPAAPAGGGGLQLPAGPPGRTPPRGAAMQLPMGPPGGPLAMGPGHRKSGGNTLLFVLIGVGAFVVLAMIGGGIAVVAFSGRDEKPSTIPTNEMTLPPGYQGSPPIPQQWGQTVVDRYTIQLPIGFGELNLPTPPMPPGLVSAQRMWASALQPDGERDVFVLAYVEIPGAASSPDVLEKAKSGLYGGAQQSGARISNEVSTNKIVDGINFLQIQYTLDINGATGYGFAMFAVSNNRLITMNGTSTAPPGVPRFETLESIALSFDER